MKKSEFTKFSPETETCYGKNYTSFIPAFASQFQDSYCYANIIQFLIVSLIYFKIGRGRYWRILFIAATAGFCGSILENLTVAYICRQSQIKKNGIVVPFIFDEFFWAIEQYAIPLLNLSKLKIFQTGKKGMAIKLTIFLLSVPFLFFRFMIGFDRMMKGYLIDERINKMHGVAFGIIAFSDLICGLSILHYMNRDYKESSLDTLSKNIKRSSYTIILCVDFTEVFLSLFKLLTCYGVHKDMSSIAVPFQCLTSNFILLLAIDVLLFKYTINPGVTSSFETLSSNGNSTMNINNNTGNNRNSLPPKGKNAGEYNSNPTIVASHPIDMASADAA